MKDKGVELKPCPFCGGQAIIVHIPMNTKNEMGKHPMWTWNYEGMFVVGCETEMCFANIDHEAMIFLTEEQAMNTWNSRAKEAADVVPVVRCEDCVHRDPEDHKCDSGQLERAGCIFPVDDNYFCAHGKRK